MGDPAIILADEPTGNLDTATSTEIMGVFDVLHKQGNTIILVTHEPDIAMYARRIVQLRDGKVEKDEEARWALAAAFGSADHGGVQPDKQA